MLHRPRVSRPTVLPTIRISQKSVLTPLRLGDGCRICGVLAAAAAAASRFTAAGVTQRGPSVNAQSMKKS